MTLQFANPTVKLPRTYTKEDLDIIERTTYAQAREHLYAYRRLIRFGNFTEGWWQQEVATELMLFYSKWKAGLRPVLILQAPPQHGKSTQIHDFLSFVAGKDPATKTIYASYGDDLGLAANASFQRSLDMPAYKKVFSMTQLPSASGAAARRNSSYVELVNNRGNPLGGSFRNTTVKGAVTGMGLDLGVIDDPIKNRKEAQSPTVREDAWLWLTDDFLTRFSEMAGLIMIMTRWHLDDPAGRLLEKDRGVIDRFNDVKVLNYPALGRFDSNGKWIEDNNGEPLFPELKSKTFLLGRKAWQTIASWSSLYQQNPIVVGGDMFPIDKFKLADVVPAARLIKRSVRYWDKAGTEGGGAYTAGVLMHELHDGTFFVEHVVRGQWSALQREQRIRQQAELDNRVRMIDTYVEQEPGSGGKESAENTIRKLRGFKVYADKVTSSKEIRADPYAAQVQAGNVAILKADWTQPFIDEHETFPNGSKKDQVDSAAAAFVKLVVRASTYDSSMSWVTGSNGKAKTNGNGTAHATQE